MFTLLACDKNKMLVGNRKGRVFAANIKWFLKHPDMFNLPIVTGNPNGSFFVVIPVMDNKDYIKDHNSESVFKFRIVTMKSFGYNSPHHFLYTCCGYDEPTKRWYVTYLQLNLT